MVNLENILNNGKVKRVGRAMKRFSYQIPTLALSAYIGLQTLPLSFGSYSNQEKTVSQTIGSEEWPDLVFSQVVDSPPILSLGTDPITSTFSISNTSNQDKNLTINFNAPISIDGVYTNEIQAVIPSGGIYNVSTDGLGDQEGNLIGTYATVRDGIMNNEDNSGLNGSEVFNLAGKVSVPASKLSREYHVGVEAGGDTRTGFSAFFFGFGGEEIPHGKEDVFHKVDLALVDENGDLKVETSLGTFSDGLEDGEQVAKYLDEIPAFNEYLQTNPNFKGTVQAVSRHPFAMMGINQDNLDGKLSTVSAAPEAVYPGRKRVDFNFRGVRDIYNEEGITGKNYFLLENWPIRTNKGKISLWLWKGFGDTMKYPVFWGSGNPDDPNTSFAIPEGYDDGRVFPEWAIVRVRDIDGPNQDKRDLNDFDMVVDLKDLWNDPSKVEENVYIVKIENDFVGDSTATHAFLNNGKFVPMKNTRAITKEDFQYMLSSSGGGRLAKPGKSKIIDRYTMSVEGPDDLLKSHIVTFEQWFSRNSRRYERRLQFNGELPLNNYVDIEVNKSKNAPGNGYDINPDFTINDSFILFNDDLGFGSRLYDVVLEEMIEATFGLSNPNHSNFSGRHFYFKNINQFFAPEEPTRFLKSILHTKEEFDRGTVFIKIIPPE